VTAVEKRLLERLEEGIDVVDSVQKLDPHQINSKHYGWMRDWLAAAQATVRRMKGMP
jgi:hypothetical protein